MTSDEILDHIVESSSFGLVPQPIFCCHRFRKNSFVEIVTGVMNPKGSKMVEAHFRISRLVLAVVKGLTSGLGDG